MPIVLITGANRGLGLEFAKQYSIDGWEVVATARSTSPELDSLGIRVEPLDMRDLDGVARFGDRIDKLDLLIANAGAMEPREARSGADGLAWTELFAINSIAPYLLGRALLPTLARTKGKLIAISSRMGSIADSSGGYVPYRSSKAALNMAWHALATEAKPSGVAAAVLNPGWVQTRMGGGSAPLAADDSIAQMRTVIDRLGIDQTGRFFDRTGSEIDW